MSERTMFFKNEVLRYGKPHDTGERLNALTHAVGAGLSIAGLIFLLVLTSVGEGGFFQYIAFTVYGSFQILLYFSSMLSHQFTDMPKVYNPMRVLDQSAIYLLIAGTYTPFALLVLPPVWGWWILGIVWTMAVFGILLKSLVFRDQHLLTDLLYLPMGWLIIAAARPLTANSPPGMLRWVIIGGLCYSIGIPFYMTKKVPFSHVIWHLFVLAGGISFYRAFALYLT